MRDFVDAILIFIGAASLSDSEFASLASSLQIYTVELYTELLAIIDARESVSGTRDRLTCYFLARGVEVSASSPGRSNIYIGGTLCD